jgi:hypothetical protein
MMQLRTLALALLLACSAAQAQMIKFTAIWEVAGENAAVDRWYRQTHSQETLEAVGPWLTRYWSYRGIDVAAEADRFNVVRYRLTEMWYPSVEARDESQRNFYPLSPPPLDPARFPNKNRIAQMYVSATPSEKYLDALPRDRTDRLRWVFFIRYPAGVSVADGERWFKEVHAPELAKLAGLRRFVSYRSIDPPRPQGWVRMCELWFDDYAAWKNAVLDHPPSFTPPAWSRSYPFVDVVSIFTLQWADMNFLRDYTRVP